MFIGPHLSLFSFFPQSNILPKRLIDSSLPYGHSLLPSAHSVTWPCLSAAIKPDMIQIAHSLYRAPLINPSVALDVTDIVMTLLISRTPWYLHSCLLLLLICSLLAARASPLSAFQATLHQVTLRP